MEGPGLVMWKGTRCSDCLGVRGLAGCTLSRGVCSSPWREVVMIPVFAESAFLCWVSQLRLSEGQRGAVGGSGRLGGDPPRSCPGPHWSRGGGPSGRGLQVRGSREPLPGCGFEGEWVSEREGGPSADAAGAWMWVPGSHRRRTGGPWTCPVESGQGA